MGVIRINEDGLHRIIMESVIRVLNEADDKQTECDYYIKKIAIDALKKAGYDSIFGDNGYLSFKVGISSYDDIGVIRNILTNVVKPKSYDDLRVSRGYGMSNYCEIGLPPCTHSNLF